MIIAQSIFFGFALCCVGYNAKLTKIKAHQFMDVNCPPKKPVSKPHPSSNGDSDNEKPVNIRILGPGETNKLNRDILLKELNNTKNHEKRVGNEELNSIHDVSDAKKPLKNHNMIRTERWIVQEPDYDSKQSGEITSSVTRIITEKMIDSTANDKEKSESSSDDEKNNNLQKTSDSPLSDIAQNFLLLPHYENDANSRINKLDDKLFLTNSVKSPTTDNENSTVKDLKDLVDTSVEASQKNVSDQERQAVEFQEQAHHQTLKEIAESRVRAQHDEEIARQLSEQKHKIQDSSIRNVADAKVKQYQKVSDYEQKRETADFEAKKLKNLIIEEKRKAKEIDRDVKEMVKEDLKVNEKLTEKKNDDESGDQTAFIKGKEAPKPCCTGDDCDRAK